MELETKSSITPILWRRMGLNSSDEDLYNLRAVVILSCINLLNTT
jgi:hypothetical protein